MSERLSIINEDFQILEGPQFLHKLIAWRRDACALDFLGANGERHKYSYQDLWRCVLSARRRILRAVKSDHQTSPQIVPVLLPQSPGLYISILAILESEAAFCPINLDSPPDRVKFVIEDVSARLIITTRQYEHLVTWKNGPQVLIIDEYPVVPTGHDGPNSKLDKENGPEDLAYVMYTSGSSGTPKGVAVSHLAVSQSLLAHDTYIPRFSRFLQFAAPSFDVSIFEIFFPLFRGSTLVGCGRPQLLNNLNGIINELEIDAAELTPTVVSSLVQERSNVPGLKVLLTIGEMLTRPVIDSFGTSEGREGILYAMYGPTEAAIHCTINSRMKSGDSVANIGVPFKTVATFIAAITDPSNQETEIEILPVGEVGELVLAGPQLADEYLNREEQNRAAFVTVGRQRAYRTGDKARMTTDNTIEILGRISSGQVKIRGQRAELGEIEEAIYRHAGVKTVLASVLYGILVAFVLAKEERITGEDIIKTCTSWLPTFMVPSEVLIFDRFPYLPSGKVDKRKLEANFTNRRTEGDADIDDCTTDTERMIREIVQDLLGTKVSSTARLSTFGLDSLMAIRLASALPVSGFRLSPVEILKADNIRFIAQRCEDVCSTHMSSTIDPVESGDFCDLLLTGWEESCQDLSPDEVDYIIPCTPLQDAMLSETMVHGSAYRNRIVLELQNNCDVAHARAALQELAAHNAILRTGFVQLPHQSSTYSQVVWRTLPSVQIEIVEDISSTVLDTQHVSLLHPLYIQLCVQDDGTRALLHIHHALYDAWSVELLLDDLDLILRNEALPPRPSFAQIVKEYRKISCSEEFQTSRDYWRDHLAQLDTLSLPNFHSVTNISRGLSVTNHMSSIATKDLDAASRLLGVSSQSLFQAAYALVLSSYLGSDDVCFGTVFSGRTTSIPGIEDIVGPCLATLPIRMDLTTKSSIQDLVQHIHLINRRHLEHDLLPLLEIKKSCGVDPGRSLFDSLVVWQQTLHASDHKRECVNLVDSVDYLEFNLTLEITPSPGHVFIKANYQSAIFPPRQIDMLLNQLEQLVSTIIKTPEISLNHARALLSEDLLSIENVNFQGTLRQDSLSAAVELMAAKDPHEVAIDFAHFITADVVDIRRLTYGQLNAKANQLAHYLVRKGIQPDDLVCICLQKSVELYISILATSKTGAGYLPVTPDTPKTRIQQILIDSKAKVILTHSLLVEVAQTEPSSVIFLDQLDLSNTPNENLLIQSKADNLAYCVFTSGSTGTPKGVLVTQGNLLSNLQVLSELYPHSHNSRFLQSCSQAFDVSVFEIFFAWYVGGRLCSATKDVLFRDIELAIRTLEITHLSLTPTVAALVTPANVPRVEFLVTAGEAVTEKVFNTWADHGLYQGYGPSEITNICTVRPKVTSNHSINNIGPPLPNTSVFVLQPGDDFMLVPRGGEGEFCFGGMQVGRGYLDPSQAVGKFIHHPKYGPLYRSGDYGRLLPDGSLCFTRRRDDQVKIRGQRVELGEITNALIRSSEVRDCVTMVMEGHIQTEQRLISFLVPKKSWAADFAGLPPDPSITEKLFASLKTSLPTYMIPSALIPVTRLPSTSQGKIDKRRLIEHYKGLATSYLKQTSDSQKTAAHHAWTIREREIAKTVAELTKLPLSEIEPDTSFFTLGIDSVSAISLSRLLREEVGISAEISDILKYPSVVRLANRVSDALNITESGSSDPASFSFGSEIEDATRKSFAQDGRIIERIMPCTPLQEAMLSTNETSSDGAYKNQILLDLRIDTKQFEKVWAIMVERHEILRTCFVPTNHARFAIAQVVLKEFQPEWMVISEKERDPALSDVELISDRMTDAERYPPYNLAFIKSPQSTHFRLSMHHALYDGFAISVLFEEVEKAIRNEALPSPVSFAPFLNYMSSRDLVEADVYWSNLLNGLNSSLFLQSEPVTGQVKWAITSCITRIYSSCKLSWLGDQIKIHSSSLLPVCQAALASVLSCHLQKTDICFGNVVSGRTVPVKGVDRLVAPCFNTVPVRLKDLHRMTFQEVFRKLQSQNIDCLPFQLTSLRRIQSRLNMEDTRIFNTLLILQTPAKELDSSIWSITEDNGTIDLPVVIEIVPQPFKDNLEIILHSHETYMSQSEANDFLKQFDSVLTMSLQNPRHMASSVSERLQGAREQPKTEEREPMMKVAEDSTEMSLQEQEIRDVIAVYTEVSRDRIRLDTSIFRLGLDSISAVQVAVSLRKLGYSIIGSDVLQNPSIAKLAAHLNQKQPLLAVKPQQFDFVAFDQKHRKSVCSQLRILSKNIDAIRPCTPVQCGMLAETMHSDSQEYINSLCFELAPGTSLTRMRFAWESALKAHEMLRTGFVEIEDSKTPFAMVTYRDKYASLPWTEEGSLTVDHGSDNDDISLPHCPWRLEVFEENAKTFIKFTAHHAIYDAQSLELVLSEIAKAYVLETSPPPANRDSISPILGAILVAADQNEAARKSFWQKEQISSHRFPDLTPLQLSSMTSLLREKYSTISHSELEKLCQQQDVSVQAAGQAAWARLLSAYVGEPRVTFGLTLSGRSILEKSESIAFPTIVTLPVTIDIAGTNGELLNRTMSLNAKLHEHQFTPLTSIQKWTGYAGGKLFDTLFAYQKIKTTDEFFKVPWKVVREEASAEYAVSMEMQPTRDGRFQLRLTFKENLMPAEQADMILRQFNELLLDTLINVDRPCDSAQSLNKQVLSITPAAQPDLPSPVQLLHEFVEMQARQMPERTAFEFTTNFESGGPNTNSLSFRQLDEEGNKISNMLLSRGVTSGDLIAICFEKCPEASFAVLGILKAGCAYVALDPSAPPDRLKYIIGDSKSRVILTCGKLLHTLSEVFGTTSHVRVLDVSDESVFGIISTNSPIFTKSINPQDTCYCLYTSGTTGTPKGCEITHENAVQAMMSFQKLFEGHWTENSKWLQFASFHFDVSVLEQFWSWSVGICVASAPRDLIFEDLPGTIRQMGITHIDLTPSLARLLHPDDVPFLIKGVFITGGEQLKQEILDVWGDYNCIYNGYGPTETTIGVTMYPRVPKNGKPSNIGPQFRNVGSYVFQLGTTEPVLRGGIGELCVSGKLLGKGYLNRPDLTRERFPYLDEFGERVYRTGDLVRILHDGSFLFLGRVDDQVKLRGQRLELSEINEVVKRHVHGIKDVVTLVLKHVKQQKEQLVTFFVASLSSDFGLIHSMRETCRAHVPGYMVPTYFIPLQKIPLSANNKADFRQLAKTFDELSVEDLQNLGAAERTAQKWTRREEAVLEALARILKVEAGVVKSSTNIFELGVDSISVIGFAKSLQAAGFPHAKLSTIMKNSSIQSLVRMLASEEHKDESSRGFFVAASQRIAAFSHRHKLSVAEELGIDASAIECLAPCTPAQEGMIYRFMGSDEALYFTKFDFVLDDSADEKRLKEAWQRTIDHLQILRTKFVLTSDGCAQVVLREYSPIWKIKEAGVPNQQTLPSNEFSEMGKAAALVNPYSLSIIRSKKERVISLTIFHGLYDGISLPMLVCRVHREYQNATDIDYGPEFHSVLPYGPLATPEGAETFWRDTLKRSVLHSMPRLTDKVILKDVTVSKVITGTKHLEGLRQELGITYQALLQAVWCSVIQEHLTPNLTIGLVLSGRSIDVDNAEKVIGPLLNTVPLHVQIADGMTWKKLIHDCHEYNMRLLPFQHTALKNIQKWCGHGTGQALFDTLFVFQQEDDDSQGMEKLWKVLPSETVADYPLAFEAQLNRTGDIALTIIGQRTFIDEPTALNLLARVESALQALQSPDDIIPHLATTHEVHNQIAIAERSETRGTSSSNDREKFVWAPEAQQLKIEIESLANTSNINENISIFELGLDSIDVIKLVSRLRKKGFYISVSSVVRSQTIAKMVGQLSADQPILQPQTITMEQYEKKLIKHLRENNKLPENAVTVLPVTPLQEGMVAEMLTSQFTRYFNHEIFRVAGHVNMEKLKEAWNTVLNRNAILRTRFMEIDDVDLPMSFAQVVYHPIESYWETVNLPSDAVVETDLKNLVQKSVEAAKNGSLLQLQDVKHGRDQYYILSIAHALYDGWSLRALHHDVWTAYHGTLGTRPDPRATLELVANVDGPEAINFWKSSLTGIQKSLFPEKLEPDVKDTSVHRHERSSRHSLDKLQMFCKSSNISLQTIGQTTWALVLATYLKRLDVAFGAVLSCRDTEEANELMFPLMNTVAVRSVIHGSVIEMLQYMQEISNSIRRYQHFPLRKAQALAGVHDSNLFDTLFIYQGRARTTLVDEDKLYEAIESVSEVEFAACVEMEIVGDTLVWRTACKASVFSAAETDVLIDTLDEVLGNIMDGPERPTVSSTSAGISICGLPIFESEDSKERGAAVTTRAVASSPNETWTTKELTLRKVLSQVSKIPEDQINKNQTIFHLGLDSISAIKVSSLLRRQGVRLSVNEMMKNNIEDIAKVISDVDSESSKEISDVENILAKTLGPLDRETAIRKVGAAPANVEDILPVTAGQLYMLARWQSSRGSLFVGTFEFRIDGRVSRQRLETAWQTLLRAHPILRTIFLFVNDKDLPAVQVVLKESQTNIRWTSHPEEAISLTSPVSLTVAQNHEESVLVLRIHHALYDAISLSLLLSDLQFLYFNPPSDIVPEKGFREFLARACDRDDAMLHRQRRFWTSYLDESTLLGADCAVVSEHASRVEVFEPDVPINNVSMIAQRYGLSVDAILLAAFSKIYNSLTEKHRESAVSMTDMSTEPEDVVFGLYLANRAVYGEDLSKLTAPALNLLPIRVNANMGMTDAARKIQTDLQLLGSSDIAGTSLAQIYEWTGVRVNCFVNILKPGENEDSGEQLLHRTGEHMSRARAGIVGVPAHIGTELGNEESLSGLFDAYLPSVDIEIRVTSRGRGLDIGIFAPLELMQVEEARRVVEEMKAFLGGLGSAMDEREEDGLE